MHPYPSADSNPTSITLGYTGTEVYVKVNGKELTRKAASSTGTRLVVGSNGFIDAVQVKAL